MIYQICDALCLDSAGSDGLTSEVSAVIPLEGRNAVQASVVLYALTANNLSLQLQVSNDGMNWQNQGTAQTMNGIGRQVFTTEGGIAADSARVLFTLDGTGKAILDAHAACSEQ